MSPIDPAVLADLLRQSVNEGKRPFLNVISNSMAPLLRRGDQIRIGPAAAEKLQPGDIVVFLGPANIITHRYWGFYAVDGQTCLITKGDRPQHFDKPFPRAGLVGQVTGRRRKRRLLNLSGGGGRWLNKHLASLAKFEIRLVTKPLSLPGQARPNLPPAGGRLAHSPTMPFVWLIRRFLYSWAIILHAIISTFTSTLISDIED